MYWPLALLAALPTLAARQDECNYEELVPRISAAAAELTDALSTAVAWEDYLQEVFEVKDPSAPIPRKLRENTLMLRRRLGSDILLARVTSGQYYGFRDVAQVNGREVAERGERIRRLFIALRGDPSQARALIDESARFNIGYIQRNLNVPTLVLQLLLPESVGRIDFRRLIGRDSLDGTCVVAFREVRGPYLVGREDGLARPLEGSLAVIPASGRLKRVIVNAAHSAGERIELTVDFDAFEGFDQLLPSRMTEVYLYPLELTRCEARYSNYRRFSVESTEEWRIPK